MKYSVVFSSKTGNTQQLANAITSLLPESDLIYFGPPSECALQADRFYIGFWTDKGHCNAEIAEFLKHLKGKDIFLFGTAALAEARNTSKRFLQPSKSILTAAIL